MFQNTVVDSLLLNEIMVSSTRTCAVQNFENETVEKYKHDCLSVTCFGPGQAAFIINISIICNIRPKTSICSEKNISSEKMSCPKFQVNVRSEVAIKDANTSNLKAANLECARVQMN